MADSTPHIPHIPLNTGAFIPQFGIGTYKMSDDEVRATLPVALNLGYRHVDTAQMYHNEAAVGQALHESGVAREDIFLTTKLDNPNHAPARARETFEQSLRDLRTDYVDLFLIHWPLPMEYGGDFLSTWKVMEEFVAEGKARAIGVSNFQQHHLETLIEGSDTVPAVNQIERHPYFRNTEVAEFCRENGIVIEAWAPLVRGKATSNEVIEKIAASHGCTPAQAIIAWHIAKGNVIFPKSTHRERLAENLAGLEVQLTVGEMEEIDVLDMGEDGRTGYHPDTMVRSHPLS